MIATVASSDIAKNAEAALDRDWLSKWVQPQHLTSSALAGYQEAYASHPASTLRLPQILRPEIMRYLFLYMSSEAEYEPIFGLYSPDAKVPEQEWLAAEDSNRMYQFSQMRGTRPDVRSLNPFLFAKFREALCDARFLLFFQALTGTPLAPLKSFAGNAFGTGDYLRPHHDFVGNRRIAYIFYLTPKWSPGFGGALHMFSHDNHETVLEVEDNSLVVFDVHGHREHYVAPVCEAAGEYRRLTLGGWFDNAA